MAWISKIKIDGFKSIESDEIQFDGLNILIGANGAGKSNVVSFFSMLHSLINGELNLYVQRNGGPDAILRYGRATTEKIVAKIYFGMNGYFFTLVPTTDNKLIFERESLWFEGLYYGPTTKFLGSGHPEALAPDHLKEGANYKNIAEFVVPAIKGWRVYHFHDTSQTAKVKQQHNINDNIYLRSDASNLAAFLLRVQDENPNHYLVIRNTIRMVAPYFGDFVLRPSGRDKEKIQLEWTEINSDVPFFASQLSDGTLRFICLAVLLLQPVRPDTIIIDEPELGLHPYAIALLASLMRSASKQGTQIIASTQSVPLLDEFEPEDIIVVDRINGVTTTHRLSEDELAGWLSEYTLSEVWEKNVIGGKPSL